MKINKTNPVKVEAPQRVDKVKPKTAIIIGSGFGGLSLGIRLQSLGFDTTILEKRDAPGGRAYVHRAEGFTFDMGPTVITVPHFIEELFSLERGKADLDSTDFPNDVFSMPPSKNSRPNTSRYVNLVPIIPFYRIYFHDNTFFDYDGDPENTRRQIEQLGEPGDIEGYARFHRDAKAIFERGFLQLGYTHFGDLSTMLKVVPDLLKLDAVRSLFSFTSRYFKSDKLRRVFSFEPLLVGGNPLNVPAIYAMIHFVEKTWGIHFAMGGTGALVSAFVRKFEELGGTMRYQSEVSRINIEGGLLGKKIARGVTLSNNTTLAADLVASNGDYAHTYMQLIDKKYRIFNSNLRIKTMKQSMSLVVIYFGFRADGLKLELRHHNILLSQKYESLLTDIFERKVLSQQYSQYLHIPTLTDPSLAPPGHHAAYTLVPVPHNGSKLNWSELGDKFVESILGDLDDAGYIPGLRERLVYKNFITPDYFEQGLNSYLGNAFGPEPVLAQSAFFRPHNRSEDIERLYLVGASYQPGGGTPSVMMSAKMTARLIAKDFAVPSEIVGSAVDQSKEKNTLAHVLSS
jgi:phytoene desaturase